MTEGRSLCLPTPLGFLHNDQQEIVGYRRAHVKHFDPHWRTLFPNLNLRNFLRLGILLAQELHGIHKRLGLIVLDLKPHNLCFSDTSWGPWPVWIDFDRATPIGSITGDETTHTVLGTLPFVAPEQTQQRTLPEPVARIMLRGMAQNPKDRFPTCRDLAEAMRRALRDLTHDERHEHLSEPLSSERKIEVADPIRYS